MFAIIGIVVVMGAVFGGFMLEGGHMYVLFQPIELLIIGGAALGSFLIAAPKSVIITSIKKGLSIFTAKEPSTADFLDLLTLLYEIMNIARREGIVALETHVNKPDGSAIFGRFKSVAANHVLRDFICDNVKVLISESIETHRFDSLMSLDISTIQHHELVPPAAINKVADSLPGLGIVAAVLGVVLTMGKINEPPEILGHSIGAALVGTFLGILLCYGFVGPAAANIEHQAGAKMAFLTCAKEALLGMQSGFSPMLSVEMGRRAVPEDVRPSFEDLEGARRGKK
ncbi:MAG: flagellar motor stator protein MotA [Desulfovibrio sp.]|nr:flagellar motor stator protein MotA [Desulfovibrio sp.]